MLMKIENEECCSTCGNWKTEDGKDGWCLNVYVNLYNAKTKRFHKSFCTCSRSDVCSKYENKN
jgi:hypothetical protein